jgi:membrane-bound metal-dependent hydrolase YbcI (DUF457 family)
LASSFVKWKKEVWFWVALVLTMFLGDAWVDARAIDRDVRLLSDPLVHGIIGALMMAIIRARRPAWPRQTILLGALLAMSIDIDHAIAARSLDLHKMISLDMRPPTHSLTFALLAAAVVGLVLRNGSSFWFVFVALASHVLRDSYTGTLLFYPLYAATLLYPSYIVSELVLIGLASWLTPDRSPLPRWLE